jgi:N-acetylmuramoyl-L-alanine amidase
VNKRRSFSNIFLVKSLLAYLLLLANVSLQAATVINASVLPVNEYTRITIETDQAAANSMMVLKSPNRIVLDLKNTPINKQLMALTTKSFPDDSNIKQVRVANFRHGITRVVIDLNAEAKSKLSVYKPSGDYQYRLALDICPLQSEAKLEDNHQNQPSEAEDNHLDRLDSTARSSKSSGAKIILDPEPVEIEPDAPPETD